MRLPSLLASAALVLLTGPAAEIIGLPAVAPAVAAPERAILTIAEDTGARTLATFDRARLEGLGTRIVRTTTPWTDGVGVFEGVLMRDVLASAGVQGRSVKVSALNDYSYTIPAKDLTDYPVILAFKINGRDFTSRDKGPFWVIYPRDDYPELKTKEIEHRMVWQVNKILVP